MATLEKVRRLVAEGQVRISDHGYDELADDDIFAADMVSGLPDAVAVEDYPDASKGPSVLVLQRDAEGRPVHVVWGLPAGHESPAVLVTAYRPDPARWTTDFLVRKR